MIHDLVKQANEERGMLCLGLDPPGGSSPKDARGLIHKALMEAGPFAAAAKANIAMYLRLGPDGINLLASTLQQAKELGLVTILDAKWADVHHTMEHYAAAREGFGADLVTLNPYLGLDPLEPLLDRAFVVCRTTNPGATVVQEHGEPPVAKTIAEAAEQHGAGLVLPGNAPDRLKEALDWAPTAPLLIPGLGAQGGEPQSLPDLGDRGVLVNVGRAILTADDLGMAAQEWSLALTGY